MTHGLAPLVSAFPAIANVFVVLDGERVVSAVHALISALYAPYRDGIHEDSSYLDLAHVACKLAQAPNVERDYSYLKTALTVLMTAVEQGTAPPSSLEPLAEMANNAIPEDAKLTHLLTQLGVLLSSYGLGGAPLKDKED